MKKILFLVITLSVLVVSVSFAKIVRVQSGNKVEAEWQFSPEVYTRLGYNLDWNFFGMEGKAKLKLKTEIRAKSDEEFVDENPGAIYAQIEVKDLEIEYELEAGPDFESRKAEKEGGVVKISGETGDIKQGLLVKWGDINGTLFLGPAYIKMGSHAKEGGLVNYVESLSDMDYVTIREDVISPVSTARGTLYANQRELKVSDDGRASASGTELKNDGTVVNAKKQYNQLGSVVVGFKLDDIVDVSVGFSTVYSYRDAKKAEHYNPMAVSITAELLAIENLTLKLKNSYIVGQKNEDFLIEDNPIQAGILVGYDLDLGAVTLTPILGFDVTYSKRYKIYNITNEDDTVDALSYEAALGVKLTGPKDNKDAFTHGKTTGVMDLFDGDEKVTDGLGLGVVFGSTPNQVLREVTVPYMGVKLTYWDSEDGALIGFVPGLKLGFVTNVNYSLGSESKTVKDIRYEFKPQLDLGVGIEGEYLFSFLKFKYGILFKQFDLTEEGGIKNPSLLDESPASNRQDLRARFGVSVVDVVPHTEFELMWESGDLLRQGNESISSDGYDSGKNYFQSASDAGITSPESAARFGFIYLGAKVSF